MYVYICIHTYIVYHCNNNMRACSVMSNSLQPYGLEPARLLCPWGFSRQEYWSGLSCPPPGDFPNPGSQSSSLMSPALPGKFFTTSTTWEAHYYILSTCVHGCDIRGFIQFSSSIHNVWRVTIGKFRWSKLQMKILGLRWLTEQTWRHQKEQNLGFESTSAWLQNLYFFPHLLSFQEQKINYSCAIQN